MNEQIKSKIFEWMPNLENLTSDQVPLFIQEICTYAFISNLIYAFIFLLSSLLFMKLTIFFYEENLEDDTDAWIGSLITCGLVFLVFFIKGLCDLDAALRAYFAPQYYVLKLFLK